MSNAADMTLTTVPTDEDPQRYFWYGVWTVLMVVSFLPLLGGPVPAAPGHELHG